MRKIIVIAHNLRSTHNVGSLLRTAEGLGIERVYFSGYTPYPLHEGDSRLPHLATKIDKQISKTALGAEKLVTWTHISDIFPLLESLRNEDYVVAALEQATNSIKLPSYQAPEKIALILGREVEGIESEVLAASDVILEIPMVGQKESFNVVQTAAMALYQFSYFR